jgi:hypothetical protein
MKILISGDRNWKDLGLIKETLEIFKPEDTTICYIDFIQVMPVCTQLGLTTSKIEEDDLDRVNYLIVFHKYIRGSVRSKILIKKCSQKNIPYQIVGSSF